MNLKLKIIANEISSGKCLVILGPRLLTADGSNLSAKLNSYLTEELGDYIELNMYSEDGFLDFDPGDITYIAEGVKQFYENEVQPSEVYEKLAEIPFPLIINTSPDKTLNKIFDQKNREYDYDYFKMRDPNAEQRRKHNTLIYNIFGDYEDIDSMVLNFKDLSTYMVGITNLKTKIKMALNDATAVLFFGFNYDKWYFQLLLSFLKLNEDNEGKEKRKKKMKNAWEVPKESVKNFYLKEFNFKFFDDNTAIEIIDQLYQATKEGLITAPENVADTPPDIYISYSHREKSDEIADLVETSFKDNGIRLIRDKTDLPKKEKISKFMKQIGKAEGVVVILSDAYLKSKYCMYELLQIYLNKDFEARIFPIVLNDAQIFDSPGRLGYKEYWKKQMEELDAESKGKGLEAAETLRDDYKLFKQIHDTFDEIFKLVPDMKSVVQSDAEASKFDAFIELIKDKG